MDPTLKGVGRGQGFPRRILVLCSKDGGGSTVAARHEAERWKELGWQVDLWRTPGRRRRFHSQTRPAGAAERCRASGEVEGLERWTRAHLERPFALLAAHYAFPHGGRAVRLARLMEQRTGRRPRVSLTLHGTDALSLDQSPLWHHLLSLWTPEVDRVECASQSLLRSCEGWGPSAVELQMTTNYTPWPPSAQATSPTPVSTARFAFAGHLTAIKDPLTALRAFGELVLPGPAELHFFGKGPLEPALRRRAARLPAQRRAVFHGAVERRAFLGALPGFDLLIACSRFESFGLAALEAVASGVPVLALAGRGYEAWLSDDLLSRAPAPSAPAGERDRALAKAWSELGSDRERRLGWARRQRAAARRFLGPALGRRQCRERARWLALEPLTREQGRTGPVVASR